MLSPRLGATHWIPNDPTLVAQILRISSAFTPPPPEGFVSPMTWGVESRFTGSPAEFLDEFRRYYGPTMNAFDAAEKNGRAASLQAELEQLFTAQNTSTNGHDSGHIPADRSDLLTPPLPDTGLIPSYN